MSQEECQTTKACIHQQEACDKLYTERNDRHKSEIAAIGHNMESALVTIKNLVMESRKAMIGRGAVERIVDDRIVIFMSNSGSRDLAKGTIALPTVISLVAAIIIFVSGYFSVRYAIDNELCNVKNSIEVNTRDISHIEKTIGERVRR